LTFAAVLCNVLKSYSKYRLSSGSHGRRRIRRFDVHTDVCRSVVSRARRLSARRRTYVRIPAISRQLFCGKLKKKKEKNEKNLVVFPGTPTTGPALLCTHVGFFLSAARARGQMAARPRYKAGNQGVREDDQLLEWAENLAADADWSRAWRARRTHIHTPHTRPLPRRRHRQRRWRERRRRVCMAVCTPHHTHTAAGTCRADGLTADTCCMYTTWPRTPTGSQCLGGIRRTLYIPMCTYPAAHTHTLYFLNIARTWKGRDPLAGSPIRRMIRAAPADSPVSPDGLQRPRDCKLYVRIIIIYIPAAYV